MTAQIQRYSFKNGVPRQGVTSPFFVFKYQKTDTTTINVAVIVSKKIDKRAAARNLIKRRILSAMRQLTQNCVQGAHIVIYTRTPISTVAYQDIAQALQQILKKEGII